MKRKTTAKRITAPFHDLHLAQQNTEPQSHDILNKKKLLVNLPSIGLENQQLGHSSLSARLARSLKPCQNRWMLLYEKRCNEAAQQRRDMRVKSDLERREYAPRTVSIKSKCERIPVKRVTSPEPWKEIWGRNYRCEQCKELVTPGTGRLKCFLCPIVQHLWKCTLPLHQSRPSLDDLEKWICNGCREHLEDSLQQQGHGIQQRHTTYLHHIAIVHIQRFVRMASARNLYQRSLRGLIQLQGALRGRFARRRFDLHYSRLYRPVNITVSAMALKDFDHLPTPPYEIFIIVTVVDSVNNQVFRQDIRYSSSHDYLSRDGALSWEVNPVLAKVPCANAHMSIFFTVVAVTATQSDTSLLRSHVEFIAQAEENLHNCVLHSHSLCSELPLGSCKFEPLDIIFDNPGSSSILSRCKFFNVWHPRRICGSINVIVQACSRLMSRCGFASELTGMNDKKPSKKVFIILEDGSLRIQTQPSDTRPRYTRLLSYAFVKLHRHGVIEVKAGGEWCHLLRFKNKDDTKKWYSILRSAILKSVGRRKSTLTKKALREVLADRRARD
jgi:hypothetical protein